MKLSHGIAERILDTAQNRMIKFGYRKVTMDEIAQDLSMSKNTIYKHFQSKEQIANAIFKRLTKKINTKQLKIEKEFRDPLSVIQNNVFFLQQDLNPWFEEFLPDIKQELPSLWEKFVHFRTEKILEIKKLIEDGIKKGVFRKINSTIAVKIFLGAIDEIINPEFLQHECISFQKALLEVLDIWANGILKTNKKRKG